MKEDQLICTAHIDNNTLAPGTYYLSAGLFGRYTEFYDWIDKVVSFIIEPQLNPEKSYDDRLGLTTIKSKWKIKDG